MEQEYIKTLIKLRNETKDAYECASLNMSEKQQWLKDLEALNWVLGELGIEVEV